MKFIKRFLKYIVGKLLAFRYTGHFQPFIKKNTGIDKLGHKPLIGWINFHQYQVLGVDTSFLGHRTLKNPVDAWVYQEVLYRVKPDVVLEIGNKNGGSTMYLAVLLEAMGHGRVLALDIDHSHFTPTHRRIDMITGDSRDPETVKKVHEYCKNKSVLIIHDADHSYQAVLEDLRNYQDLVNPPGYIIVEDTIEGMRGFRYSDFPFQTFIRPHRDKPLEAVFDFVKENKRFEIDRGCEKWILTANPYGFLKCVAETGNK
jgi:cephalosporin hydroxylase